MKGEREMADIERASVDSAGCWLAGASNRTADELSFATVKVAMNFGFLPSVWENEILNRFANQPADPEIGRAHV